MTTSAARQLLAVASGLAFAVVGAGCSPLAAPAPPQPAPHSGPPGRSPAASPWDTGFVECDEISDWVEDYAETSPPIDCWQFTSTSLDPFTAMAEMVDWQRAANPGLRVPVLSCTPDDWSWTEATCFVSLDFPGDTKRQLWAWIDVSTDGEFTPGVADGVFDDLFANDGYATYTVVSYETPTQ